MVTNALLSRKDTDPPGLAVGLPNRGPVGTRRQSLDGCIVTSR